MKLTSIAIETSFLNEQDGEHEEERNGEGDIFSCANDMNKKNELESEIEASNELDIGKVTSGNKKKWLWYPMKNLNQLDPVNKYEVK